MTHYLEFEKPLAEIEGKAEELRALARQNEEMDIEDDPIPALVDAELAGVASTEETGRLNAMLLEEIPTARVDAQSAWLRPVYDALSSLRYMALGLIVLLALGSAAAVWLAARSALST